MYMLDEKETSVTPGTEESNKENNSKKVNSAKKEMLSMLLYIGVVIIAALLLNRFVIQKVQVDGQSMEPALHSQEQLILEKVSYNFVKPERFDIVVLHPPGYDKSTLYIKRVIGLPGETVQIIDGEIYINGEELEESYGKEEIGNPGIARSPITLGDDEYFVLGDNRNASEDSRSIGVIPRENIVGKAVLRLWPLNKFGLLH